MRLLAAELAGAAACAWALEMSRPGCAWLGQQRGARFCQLGARGAHFAASIACYPAERHWRLPQVSADNAIASRVAPAWLSGLARRRRRHARAGKLGDWQNLERLEAVAMGDATAARMSWSR